MRASSYQSSTSQLASKSVSTAISFQQTNTELTEIDNYLRLTLLPKIQAFEGFVYDKQSDFVLIEDGSMSITNEVNKWGKAKEAKFESDAMEKIKYDPLLEELSAYQSTKSKLLELRLKF